MFKEIATSITITLLLINNVFASCPALSMGNDFDGLDIDKQKEMINYCIVNEKIIDNKSFLENVEWYLVNPYYRYGHSLKLNQYRGHFRKRKIKHVKPIPVRLGYTLT